MSRRNKSRPSGNQSNIEAVSVQDAFSNPMFRLGWGSQSPLEATEYPLTRMTDNYALLNSLYRDNWVVQNVIGLRPALQKLLPVLAMSAWGYVPDDFDFIFPPLWTPTAMDTAEIALKKAQTIRDTFQAGLIRADTAQKELKKLEEETAMFGGISDEEIAANKGKTYQDLTALHDPLMGYGLEEDIGGDEFSPFEGAAQDAALDYNPNQPRDKNGRWTGGGGSGKLGMSNAERRRVSSGILTDHPNLQPGESADYFFDKYYYQFTVSGPGSYRFTARIPIVGNEAYIELIKEKR